MIEKVNGAGPSWFSKKLRFFLTKFSRLFFEDYCWINHDIRYFNGGNLLDKIKADFFFNTNRQFRCSWNINRFTAINLVHQEVLQFVHLNSKVLQTKFFEQRCFGLLDVACNSLLNLYSILDGLICVLY